MDVVRRNGEPAANVIAPILRTSVSTPVVVFFYVTLGGSLNQQMNTHLGKRPLGSVKITHNLIGNEDQF